MAKKLLSLFFLFAFSQPVITFGSNNVKEPVERGDRVVVNVMVTDAYQPPITFDDGRGLSREIFEALNEIQGAYQFVHFVVPVRRLEELASEGKVHIASFYNLGWSFGDSAYSRTPALLTSGDVFISSNETAGDDEFFENLENLSKAVVQGFHYSFIESDKDLKPQVEAQSLIFVRSEKVVIDMVLSGRAETGVVSDLLINYYETKLPNVASRIRVSNIYDSKYDRYLILTNSSPVDVKQINSYLCMLYQADTLSRIYKKYHLEIPKSLDKELGCN